LKADIESLPINATKTYKLASNFVMPTECAHYPGEPGKCTIASLEYTINVGANGYLQPPSYPSITIIGDGKLVLDALLRDNPDPGACDLRYNYNFFHLWEGTLALHGITFKNGVATIPYPGGAIYAQNGVLSITECVFIASVASISSHGAGGGAISFGYANPIDGQSAKRNEIIASTLLITRSTFTGNVAKAYNATNGLGGFDGQGGAIVITNNGQGAPIVNITDSVFNNNIAFGRQFPNGPSGTGGAIIYVIYDGAKIVSTITGCTFRNNTADGGPGGAIALVAGSTGSGVGEIDMNITGCSFRNNNASVGGAIYSGVSASMDISNSSFTNNTPAGECYVPTQPPASCSLDFNVTETDFASASCLGAPGYKATYRSGVCCEGKRFCCNHDGSIVAYAYFSDSLCCTLSDAWNQASGKCKKLSDTSSQLFTCVKTSQLP
jgi:hypothetical protein